MTNRWKRDAAAAIAALVMIFTAAGAYSASIVMRHAPAAQAEEETQEPFVAAWATVSMTAATHEGPGLRYAMTGSISAGHGVEVVRVQDGWCKCLTYLSKDPVWISNEYLNIVE